MPLHEIVDAGAARSTLISTELVASALSATSYERYLTVVGLEITSAPVYSGLEAVGSDPSVV